jgi:putative flavoprotein involved in K+ transport
MHRIVRVDTRIGRKLRPELIAHAAPLIRRREQDLAAVGIERVERVAGVRDGLPVLADGRVVDVPNVIWCTGFRNDFSWIDLPVFDGDGQPQHYRGVVESESGLYFLGLVFQYSASSDVLPSRGRDARYIAKHIAKQREQGAVEPAEVLAAA